MYIVDVPSCCGVWDISGTQDMASTEEWFREMWRCARTWHPCTLLFTAVVRYGEETKDDIFASVGTWKTLDRARVEWRELRASEKIGPGVAKVIRKEKLGSISASKRTVNKSHGNTIQAWLWVPDYAALEKYVGTL